MREALWRGWLLWASLAAAARVATSSVVAGEVPEVVRKGGGQGECEVLDLSEMSPGYVLPTYLTVKPSEAGWRLNVTLGRGTEAAVCVRLEGKQDRLRITVLAERCEGGAVSDYNYLNVPVPLGVWTSLRVDVAANKVIVSAPDGTDTSVVTRGSPLPRNGTHMVLTGARNAEAALGCRISCPGYRHASPGIDKKVTVKEWFEDSVQFYFRPGNKFVKLDYEVACTTPLGNMMFPQVSDITPDSNLYPWHPVHLHHGSGLATVSLDNMPLKSKTLPEGCTFKRHTIRVMGDGLFSFICNPFNGEVECMENEGSSVASVATTQARMPQEVAVAVITIESIAVALLLITVLWLANKRHQLQSLLMKYKHLKKEHQNLLNENKLLQKINNMKSIRHSNTSISNINKENK
ncbi:uncharacterized protein LOC126983560 isoform X2 [Eriocheir sinensis]|uniref:uncharacterized protein LOC126983560 isoform X2 n=1 Tax=Eriocheir sinensis TaxID=95602 RepID=UPI0021C8776F|nr:uncharacterized protein LOC126983560 isoform X2 [Eriocheir sinensis]